jgi:hypothetical protein
MNHCPRCGKTNAAEIHSCTPKALVQADELERHIGEFETATRAAAELRRQYEEIEALQADVKKFREAASCERDVRQQLERIVEADEALLRQALDCLECHADIGIKGAEKIIDAIKERLI